MYIYLDESGDLGFKSVSTKYFTIVFIILDNPKYLKRIVKKVKMKYKIPISAELKGASTQYHIKKDLLMKVSKLKGLEIRSITVKKENVESKLRQDENIFYNYMVGLSLIPRILREPRNSIVNLIIDRRITSIISGFDLDKYVKYKIWFENKRKDIELFINYEDSHVAYNIQGVDIICNSIYRKYNNNDELYSLIKNKIRKERKLFF